MTFRAFPKKKTHRLLKKQSLTQYLSHVILQPKYYPLVVCKIIHIIHIICKIHIHIFILFPSPLYIIHLGLQWYVALYELLSLFASIDDRAEHGDCKRNIRKTLIHSYLWLVGLSHKYHMYFIYDLYFLITTTIIRPIS